MSNTQKLPRPTQTQQAGKQAQQAQAPAPGDDDEEIDLDDEPVHLSDRDEAEVVRSGSQTAQDRDHVIRGGDSRTAITKEFPT